MAASILLPLATYNRSHVDAKCARLSSSLTYCCFIGRVDCVVEFAGKAKGLNLVERKIGWSYYRVKEANSSVMLVARAIEAKERENQETKLRVVLVALTGYDRFLNPRRNDRLILIEFAILYVAGWKETPCFCVPESISHEIVVSFFFFGIVFEDLIVDFLIQLFLMKDFYLEV